MSRVETSRCKTCFTASFSDLADWLVNTIMRLPSRLGAARHRFHCSALLPRTCLISITLLHCYIALSSWHGCSAFCPLYRCLDGVTAYLFFSLSLSFFLLSCTKRVETWRGKTRLEASFFLNWRIGRVNKIKRLPSRPGADRRRLNSNC